jgi:hypothetical protein
VKGTRGNCFIGALWLMVVLRSWKLRLTWSEGIPHFYVIAKGGRKWQFRVTRHVWYAPWCYLWFRGRFEQIPRQMPARATAPTLKPPFRP